MYLYTGLEVIDELLMEKAIGCLEDQVMHSACTICRIDIQLLSTLNFNREQLNLFVKTPISIIRIVVCLKL